MTLTLMSRPILTKITMNPKLREKGMNVYSFVYNEILKCLWDIFFYDFHV